MTTRTDPKPASEARVASPTTPTSDEPTPSRDKRQLAIAVVGIVLFGAIVAYAAQPRQVKVATSGTATEAPAGGTTTQQPVVVPTLDASDVPAGCTQKGVLSSATAQERVDAFTATVTAAYNAGNPEILLCAYKDTSEGTGMAYQWDRDRILNLGVDTGSVFGSHIQAISGDPTSTDMTVRWRLDSIEPDGQKYYGVYRDSVFTLMDDGSVMMGESHLTYP